MIQWLKNKFEKRNYAISQVQNLKSPTPVYNNWTIQKAVAEGYKGNTWVYRSVWLIVRSLVNIPWAVKKNSEILPEHHLSKLLNSPNNRISKNDIWELFISWLNLAGNAYAIKIKVGGNTEELWPVSPDRLMPVQGLNIADWIQSYVLDKHNKKTTKNFDPSEILHFKFFNPSNPFLGIGPLQAVAKTVDIDNDQRDWSKSTMQNRGVIDGVFTFERPFESIDDADAIAEALNKKYGGKSNARKLAVLGGNAKYQRIALNSMESDFSGSRKDNRDEIFIAFGIPPQLGGSQEASTYNNYEVSILIFWFSTLIPILDDIKSELNFSFKDELLPGEKVTYDLSGIKAIRKAMLDQAATAEKLFAMGVPFEKVNRIFEFGVDEFDGWAKSYVKTSAPASSMNGAGASREKNNPFRLIETRSKHDTEKKIQKIAEMNQKVFKKLLNDQKKLIFKAIEKGEGQDAEKIIDDTKEDWETAIKDMYVDVAVKFGMDIIEQQERSAETALSAAIMRYLDQESVVLFEISQINSTTVDLIIQHVVEGLQEGFSTAAIQQALLDSGVFSESRALLLARTITGNAANMGQWKGAGITGATHKTWITAGSNVRDTHKRMNNIKIPINDNFIVDGYSARFPLDNRLPPEERVNCRCALSFSIED